MADCCNAKGNGHYGIAVIGAGSAGFSAAITAAEQGANVALIGHGTIGGTCVNVGCVPSKTMIRAAEALHGARIVGRFAGLSATASIDDWQAVVAQKDELVAHLRKAKYADLLRSYNTVAYIEGAARLADGGVSVNGRLIRAPKIIIATGARPNVPVIPGMADVDYLTSTTALELEELPVSLLVIGGGYIGCEFTQTFARAGVTVTVVSRRGLLPEAEPEIAQALAGYFEGEGIRLVSGIKYQRIEEADGRVTLDVRRAARTESLRADRVLIATGRTPNIEGLGLAEASIDYDEHGIDVDDRLRTTRPGVYAGGDVTGRDQFVYMAAYGAKLAVNNALNGDNLTYDNSAMPTVVFTDPQMASVGLTEAQAIESGYAVKSSILPLEHVPRALAARDTRGLIKLVADAKSDKLLGAHILAPEGGDSIQTAVLAIRHGMTVQDLGATIFPYLTTVEGLKLAAQAFHTDVHMLSCCAG